MCLHYISQHNLWWLCIEYYYTLPVQVSMSLTATSVYNNAFIEDLEKAAKRIPPLPLPLPLPPLPSSSSPTTDMAKTISTIYFGQVTMLGLWILYSFIGWKR
jgi:hypothetical protein